MARPAFSVIIPLYNRAPWMDATIRSVLEQTVQDFEILLIDDRSTDESYEKALAWQEADTRIRAHRLPKNTGGPALPRNVGLEQADGGLIAFLDDDDLWLPTKLEKQLIKVAQGDFALTYSRCIIDATADPSMDRSDYHEWWNLTPREGNELAQLARKNFVPLSTVAVGRKWVETVGPFRDLDGAEDWHYWLRVGAHGGAFGFIDEPLAIYRWTDTNLSHTSPVSPIARTTRTLRALADEFPEQRPLFASEERRVRRRTTELRLRKAPRRLRTLAGLALLPPRLWTA